MGKKNQGTKHGKPLAPMASLVVQPATIQAGQLATLTWATQNASSVLLGGVMVALNGSKTVNPPTTTTYTLTAKGKGASITVSTILTITPPSPPPAGLSVNVTVQNTSGSTATAPETRFAHVFKKGDVPSSSVLSIKQGGVAVPYTAARRNTWPDGSLRCVDLLCKLPSNIAGSGSDTLTLTAAAGSWNDALPNSKTVANIVTDITTNFDTIKVQLEGLLNSSGGTEGSGTWSADSTSAFAATSTHGGYRCVATGPTCADFVVWKKLTDNTGGAEHAGLWVQWYITAWLNTSTGAVTRLCWRVYVNQCMRNVAQDQYRCTYKLILNSTTVRSWGYVGDGRILSFATTAVNTTSDQITLTGHGFVTGDLVRFTTTNTLPGGLSINTDYWVRRVDANTISICADQLTASGAQGGSPIDLTTQGTGTHTITGYIHHNRFQKQCLADIDALWDWHQGLTGALGGEPTVYCIHDTSYYRKSYLAPPIDLSVDLANPTDPSPWSYSPGTNGAFDIHYGDSGARPDIGGVWNEWACRGFRYRTDRTGYVQTMRVQGLCMGMNPYHIIRDDSTFRLPVLNNQTYANLGAQLSTTYYIGSGTHTVDIPNPASAFDAYTEPQIAHWSHALYPLYIFEGGHDILDMMYDELTYSLIQKVTDFGYFTGRNQIVGARNYFKPMPSGSETRTDAWAAVIITNLRCTRPDSCDEQPYVDQICTDTFDWMDYVINTLGDTTWRAAGGWDIGELQKAGPGTGQSSNMEGMTWFMNHYCALAYPWCYLRLGGGNITAKTPATQMAKLYENFWINSPCGSYGTSYSFKTKKGPGTSYTTYESYADFGVLDSGAINPVFNNDNTITKGLNGSFPDIALQNGDRIWFTDSDPVGLIPADHSLPPSGVSAYTWYYVRQVSRGAGGDTFRIGTTNDDLNLLTWTGTVSDVAFYVNTQMRASGCPTTIYRHNGGQSGPTEYLALQRAACAYLYIAGLLSITAFNAADAYWQLEDAAGCGPLSFASQNSLMNSCVTTV